MDRERHCDLCGKMMGSMSDEAWREYKTRGGHKCAECYRRTNPGEARKKLELFPTLVRKE